jgi:hypothetical protein
MKITFEIDTENDAFDGDVVGEVELVVRRAIKRLTSDEKINGFLPDIGFALQDSNGNTVGFVKFEK